MATAASDSANAPTASVPASASASGSGGAPAHVGGPMPPGWRRLCLTVTTLVVSIMATIDATIVAVCLPQMQGALDASPSTIVWVLTMFNIGQAIGIAVTGKLALLLGRREVMIGSIIGFMALSGACGAATSLDAMVMFRFLQGFFAAPLIPLAQAVIVDAYPPAERARGLSIWSMGVVVGPAIGPAAGGVLAQDLTWRMAFYVNFPVGLLALLMLLLFVPRTPRRHARLDWTGALLVSFMIVPLQIALDQGDMLDWFGSKIICVLLGTAVIAGMAFIVRGMLVPNNILPLGLFRNRNFALCTINITLLGLIFYSQFALYPVMMEDLLGWQVDTTGLLMGAFGIAGFLGSMVSAPLGHLIGARLAVVTGALIAIAGQWVGMQLDTDMGPLEAISPGLLTTFGMMVAFVQTTSLAFANVPPQLHDDAVATYNFFKTVGLSIGVSAVSTLLYRRPQLHWNTIGGHVTADSFALQTYLDRLGVDWGPYAATVISLQLGQQSTMIAIIEIFWVMLLVMAPVIAFVAFVKPAASRSADAAGAAG